ncbi:hypothetical protein N7466_010739 [Penicillium verhagenii]|uniref:uncharacterized protein n=1 Tax=Penicillium verhagenii TaxID=1562060 RepID=UPI002545B457|nr:uncharacterized protein N7466_010739 [Penicillium verhagenii]KAJ5917185.1 hypothetical protein N7466_010739 [Penicillium verhagenii]
MLRTRIELLERVLRNHGIDAEESVAELLAEDELSKQPADPTSREPCSVPMDDLCVTFDGALTIDESLNFDQDGEVRYFGPTSGRLLFQSPANSSPVEDTDASNTGGSGATPDNLELVSPHCATKHHACPFEPELPTASKELQDHLINLYFDWDQPWLQVVNEQLFRESLASGGRYCSPLLLNCILAVGSRYCDRIDVRTDPNDPNTAGRNFICTAERLLQNDLRWPKITTIQSLAIMGLFYIATGSDAAGWLQQGMAIRLAIDMGLNMDPAVLTGTVSLPAIEIELRRQIYWALYCHDKLSACYTGRVCTLLDSQGAVRKPYLECVRDVHLPSANGQPRAANQKAVTQLQRSMIDLCRIIEKILRSLWSPKPLIHCHPRSAFFDAALLELKTWHYDLPSELKVIRTSGPSQFPHAYTLSMVYHQAMILLCSPFITHNTVQDSTQPDENTPEGTPASIRYRKALSSCGNSVRLMCCIAQKYRQTFGSFKLSPITATHCTLSTALILIELCCSMKPYTKASATDDDGKHHLPPHAAVALCFQVLRELSTSWNIAKRIGRNLERVYIQRYGSENLQLPEESGVTGQTLSHMPKSAPMGDFAVPNLEIFDDILNGKSLSDAKPLELDIEMPVAFHQTQSLNRTGIPGLALNSSGGIPNLSNSDEVFANNLGFAFSPDCLPSDYNMFDTLNQMYLEESW